MKWPFVQPKSLVSHLSTIIWWKSTQCKGKLKFSTHFHIGWCDVPYSVAFLLNSHHHPSHRHHDHCHRHHIIVIIIIVTFISFHPLPTSEDWKIISFSFPSAYKSKMKFFFSSFFHIYVYLSSFHKYKTLTPRNRAHHSHLRTPPSNYSFDSSIYINIFILYEKRKFSFAILILFCYTFMLCYVIICTYI